MKIQVPFFRVQLNDNEISEVVKTLKSGWLTSGPQARRFEEEFARAVGARHAVALNSCTAALHLAVDALGLRAGQGVLLPTMTFAATAEIVLYKNAIPILVDCDPETGNMCLADAERKLKLFKAGQLPFAYDPAAPVVGMIPVHVGGYLLNINELKDFAKKNDLWIVEDAAHAFPAAWRADKQSRWIVCGENTAAVSCYSFYANKTITTGEGGMAVTDSPELADRIRLMSLHGLSNDAWGRYSGKGAWDYKIISPGYKYNLTDIAATLGINQLARSEEMRLKREETASFYIESLASIDEIELPIRSDNRIHSWHLFPIRLKLEKLTVDRNEFMEKLKQRGIGCSVHWRPLHLHPFYIENFGWKSEHFPAASQLWEQLISLPIYSSITAEEVKYVIECVKQVCASHAWTRRIQFA